MLLDVCASLAYGYHINLIYPLHIGPLPRLASGEHRMSQRGFFLYSLWARLSIYDQGGLVCGRGGQGLRGGMYGVWGCIRYEVAVRHRGAIRKTLGTYFRPSQQKRTVWSFTLTHLNNITRIALHTPQGAWRRGRWGWQCKTFCFWTYNSIETRQEYRYRVRYACTDRYLKTGQNKTSFVSEKQKGR